MTVAVVVLRVLLNSERRSQSDIAIVLSLIVGTVVSGPIAGALVAAPLFHVVEGWALLPAFDGWWSGSAAGAIMAAPLLRSTGAAPTAWNAAAFRPSDRSGSSSPSWLSPRRRWRGSAFPSSC